MCDTAHEQKASITPPPLSEERRAELRPLLNEGVALRRRVQEKYRAAQEIDPRDLLYRLR